MTTLATVICIVLFLLWKLDFIASLLNIKALQPEIPKAFKDVFDKETFAKSQQYTCENERAAIIESVISFTLLLVFWFIGGFELLDQWIRGFGWGILWTGVAYLAIIFMGQMLASLPMSIYRTFVIEEKFGFNKTTPIIFFTDTVKSLLVGAIIGLPILALILWIFQSVPMAWLWAWISFSLIQLGLTFIAPSILLPLFNKFEPMKEGELKTAIEAMAKKCDFPLTELFVMDGSKRSTKSNAFFTGFGKNKKIALYDTLVDNHTNEELVGVLAHEIGHFKCNHIIKRIATGILKMGAIFFLLGVVTNEDYLFTKMLFDAFYVSEISTHAGLIFFMILFSPISRILGIWENMSSRKHEFEADAYATKVQGSSKPLVSALKKLCANNLANLTPHPLPVFLDYSHPPMIQRLNALEKL